MGGPTRRRFLAGIAGVAALGAVAARIGYVNATALPRQVVVHHAMGERVDLAGTFCETSMEALDGYALTVTSAALRSYNEYVSLHADDGSRPVEGLDTPCIVDLEWEIENRGNADGRLYVVGMTLTPRRANTYYIVDTDLLAATQRAIRESGNPGWTISTRPDTTFSLSMPYVYNGGRGDERGGTGVPTAWTRPMADRSFELRLTNYPVRHVVDIEV